MVEEFVNQDISAGQNVGGRLGTFENAALGTGGFHTGTLDIGVLPGHDDQASRTSASVDYSGRGSSSHGSYGGSQGSSSRNAYAESGGSGGSYGGYQSHSSRSSSSSGGGGGSTSYQSSSYPAGSVGRSQSSRTYSSEPTDSLVTHEYYGAPTYSSPQHPSNLEPVDNKFKHYGRYKRQLDDPYMIQLLAQCNNTNCAGLRCQIGFLPKDEYIYVAIRMRILSQTVKKVNILLVKE